MPSREPDRTGPAGRRVLVVGGTGFVGRHACAALQASGYEVVAAARHLPAEPLPCRFVPLDLGRSAPGAITGLLAAERPDTVVNAVGSIWGRSDGEMWDATALPVLRLLDALAESPGRPRLVHLGSVLEYGPIAPGGTTGAGTEARPTSAYGWGKLAATTAVLRRAAAGDVDAMVLRIANVSGPGTPAVSLLGRVAGQLVAAAGTGTTAVIELDRLLPRRDYVDVRDVADAVVAAVGSRRSGVLVDIGRGEAVGIRDLVQLLVDASGVPARVVEREPGRPGQESLWTQVDVSAARDVLGWRPRRSPADSVRAYWDDLGRLELLPRG